jgi:hypothetical protein
MVFMVVRVRSGAMRWKAAAKKQPHTLQACRASSLDSRYGPPSVAMLCIRAGDSPMGSEQLSWSAGGPSRAGLASASAGLRSSPCCPGAPPSALVGRRLVRSRRRRRWGRQWTRRCWRRGAVGLHLESPLLVTGDIDVGTKASPATRSVAGPTLVPSRMYIDGRAAGRREVRGRWRPIEGLCALRTLLSSQRPQAGACNSFARLSIFGTGPKLGRMSDVPSETAPQIAS